jgi:hypothetical protein
MQPYFCVWAILQSELENDDLRSPRARGAAGCAPGHRRSVPVTTVPARDRVIGAREHCSVHSVRVSCASILVVSDVHVTVTP